MLRTDSGKGRQVDWDNEPGFDEVKERYVQLDLEAWLAKHDVREEGRRQGAANLPASEADGLDATEERILAWVNRRALICRRNVSDHLADLERELVGMESDRDLEDLKLEVSELGRNGGLGFGRAGRKGRTLAPGSQGSRPGRHRRFPGVSTPGTTDPPGRLPPTADGPCR